MKKLALVLALASIAGSALAAPQTYAIDPTHTQPRFEYNHFGYSNQMHSFDKTSGTIVYDKAAKTGSVDVTIDAKSVNTGYPLFNEHIQDEDFFNTAKYPTITFKSTAVKFDGDKPVSVDGNLTIKGVTKPVTLTLTSFQAMPHPIMKKDAIGANAVTKIKRTEFNMGKYAPYVSDDVILQIPLEAVAVDKQ
ncbi:MAG: polyisoprenoid-binding protein [Thiobacillus sp. 63-78]|uniref:YceI family protein n=1 Tax=Thiobacillus sp. 63-78 TaxID=1895859 RepID=UPI00095A3595|nr:YceI family protein [Thiobacillus sp. 63-78]MBN8761815.1 polyisoprenoid-binding protein [Thiobacillus sp.]MBN8774327.1 polyisoprenoid-binding protein [Thiobacillus sp.]OJZ16266.1 MAG: polyisoprenoid-binding protein [Thiobacillus sp. 63-78]